MHVGSPGAMRSGKGEVRRATAGRLVLGRTATVIVEPRRAQ
jgi:hypothetical protein